MCKAGYLCSIMLKYILLALTGYFIFRFVTGFLLPVIRTTQLAKKQFEQMQSQMRQNMQEQSPFEQAPRTSHAQKENLSKPDKGDYIPFEEIK